MVRVAEVIQSVDSRSGGPSSAFVEILAALGREAARLEVHAFAPTPPPDDPLAPRLAALSSVRWRPTGPAGGFTSGEFGNAVASAVQRGEFDVVHLHGLWSPDLVRIARECERSGVATCWTPHGMLMEHAIAQKRLKKQIFMRMGLTRALRACAAFAFATAGEAETSVLPRGVDRSRAGVIGLPVEIAWRDEDLPRLREDGRRRFAIPEGDEVLAFIGRLHPVKRLEMTLEAFAAALRARPRARLLLLGDGDANYVGSLRDQARSLGVHDRVQFAGWVSGDQKWGGLAAADALIINSKHENFGYAIVEALSVGTPIVMTRKLSMSKEIEAARAGVVCDENAAGLADGITALLADPTRAEIGRRGRRWVIETYSHQAVARKLADLFEEIRPVR